MVYPLKMGGSFHSYVAVYQRVYEIIGFPMGIFDCPSVRQFATVLMELFFFRPSANTCHGRGDGELVSEKPRLSWFDGFRGVFWRYEIYESYEV